MRRLITILVVIVIVGGVFFLARQGLQARQEARQDAVQILDETTAETGDLRLTVNATGALAPLRQVPLLFEATGVVHDLLVKAGDTVKAGDPLAKLDTIDLEAALNDAQVTLQMQQITYDALTSPARAEDLAAAQAALTAAQAALNAAYNSVNPNQAEIAHLQSEISRNRLWQAQLQRDMAANSSGFSPDISGLIPPDVVVDPEIIARVNQGLAGLFPSVPSSNPVSEESLQQGEYGVQIADANAAAVANREADPGSVASANAAAVSAQEQLNRLENGPSDFDVQAAEININLAQLAVDQAQAALDRATLVAPFDGVIAQNNLVVGEVPPSGQAALLLMDDGELYVDLAIDETDVVKVEVGQAVELTLDALPDAEITGRVTRVAVTPTTAGQLVTYAVRVTLDPTDAPDADWHERDGDNHR